MLYYDKHGRQIQPGMTVTNGAGFASVVEDLGDGTLGILATNKSYRRAHPYTDDEYYPLDPGSTKREWEVVL